MPGSLSVSALDFRRPLSFGWKVWKRPTKPRLKHRAFAERLKAAALGWLCRRHWEVASQAGSAKRRRGGADRVWLFVACYCVAEAASRQKEILLWFDWRCYCQVDQRRAVATG
jgi:hypothetical protein